MNNNKNINNNALVGRDIKRSRWGERVLALGGNSNEKVGIILDGGTLSVLYGGTKSGTFFSSSSYSNHD